MSTDHVLELSLIEERASLFRALRQQDETIARYKQDQHALTPVGRCPVEVLLLIFTICIKDAPLKRHGSRVPWEGVRLTHVCSRWRDVAISCPTLWDIVDLGWPAWAKELVERSQEAPLTVVYTPGLKKLRSGNTSNRRFVRYVLSGCAHRIVRLHLCTTREQHRWFANFFPSFMPALRVLILSNLSLDTEPNPRLPPFLLKLPAISLIQVDGPWTADNPISLFHASLETLQIKTFRPNVAITWAELYIALQRMSRLKYFSSRLLIEYPTVHVRIPDRPIVLPALTHLAFSSDAAVCSHFIESFQFPSLKVLKVNSVVPRSIRETSPLCLLISETIARSPHFPSLSRVGLQHGSGQSRFTASGPSTLGQDPSRFSPPRSRIFLDIWVQYPSMRFPMVLDLAPLTSRLNLSNVEQLDLDLDHAGPSLEALLALPSVTTLRLWNQTSEYLHELLHPTPPLPLPRLKRLEIWGVTETDVIEGIPPEVRASIYNTFKGRSQDPRVPFQLCIGESSSAIDGVCAAIVEGTLSSYQEGLQSAGDHHTLNIDSQSLGVWMICDDGSLVQGGRYVSWDGEWTYMISEKKSVVFAIGPPP